MATRAKPKPRRRRPAPPKKVSLSSEERRRKRVGLAIANPVYFGETYMRPYTARWNQPLPRVAGAMLLFAQTVRRGVIWTPPEWLKTTVISQVWPTFLTYRYAQLGQLDMLSGMLTSEEAKLAERNLSVISWHIEFNERLQRDFIDELGRPLVIPDAQADKWTDSEIVVARSGTSKDPTWQAKGLTSKGVQGSRLTHLIGDDVITPRTAASPTEQQTAERLWDEQFTPRLVTEGKAMIAGNYNGDRDLLAKLSRRKAYKVFKRPSLHMPGKPSVAPEDPTDRRAVVALPEKWPRDRLQREREEKPNKFRRIHLMDSTAEAGERLKVDWMSLIAPEETLSKSAGGGLSWFIGIDTAPGGESDDLDFFNITIAGLHGRAGEQHLDIAVCHDIRAGFGEQSALLGQYVENFERIGNGVRAIGVASIALDNYFRDAIKVSLPHLEPKLVPIKGMTVQNKWGRLEALGPYARTGWLRCWDPTWRQLTSQGEDQHEELSLFEQWRDMPAVSHDDKLDGVDVCQRTARLFGHRGKKRKATLKVANSRA